MFNYDINLNLYKIFYEVAMCENISISSKKLFITQSAVSKAIKKLESDINVRLFLEVLRVLSLLLRDRIVILCRGSF